MNKANLDPGGNSHLSREDRSSSKDSLEEKQREAGDQRIGSGLDPAQQSKCFLNVSCCSKCWHIGGQLWTYRARRLSPCLLAEMRISMVTAAAQRLRLKAE